MFELNPAPWTVEDCLNAPRCEPGTSKTPLTAGGKATWGNVYIVEDPKASAPGGWAFHTGDPRP